MEFSHALVMILMAVSLSAAAGLRAFLPLFAISLLSYTGYIQLVQGFEWLATPEASLVFGLAVVLEVLADKVPVLDNALDAVGLAVKPLAAALLSSAIITGMDPLLSMVLGLIVGGSVAGTVHIGKAKLRLLSTTLTGGTGNQAVSLAEDGISFVGTALSVIAPILGGLFTVGVVWLLARKLLAKRKPKVAASVYGPDGEFIREIDASQPG